MTYHLLQANDHVRTEHDTDKDIVIKTALTSEGIDRLYNSYKFYTLLSKEFFMPELVSYETSKLITRYIKDSPIKFFDNFRRCGIYFLDILKKKNVIHSDLTFYNIIPHTDSFLVTDWDESLFTWEDTTKRGHSDADFLWESLLHYGPDPSRILDRWLIIRTHLQQYRGWGTLQDFGCLYGDFCGLSQSESLLSAGYDNGSFDSDCIMLARSYYDRIGCVFNSTDLIDIEMKPSNVVLCLAVWTYIYNRYGKERSYDFIRKMLDNSEVLFFETHLEGDGFGPEFLKSEHDIAQLLIDCGGIPVNIGSVVVPDRNLKRTLWKVT